MRGNLIADADFARFREDPLGQPDRHVLRPALDCPRRGSTGEGLGWMEHPSRSSIAEHAATDTVFASP